MIRGRRDMNKLHFYVFLILCLQMGQVSAGESLFGEAGVRALTPADAPEISLLSRHGAMVSSSELKGQLILVNFWATWCSPCLTEMPALNRLYLKYKDQGFALLAVNTDSHETKRISTIVRKLKLDFPILLDEKGEVSKQFNVSGMPASYLISRDQQLIAYIEGARDWDGEAAHRLVEQLLIKNQ